MANTVQPARTVISPRAYDTRRQMLAQQLGSYQPERGNNTASDIGSQLGAAINQVGQSYMLGSLDRQADAERSGANDRARAVLAARLAGQPLPPDAIDVIGNEWTDPAYQQVVGGLIGDQLSPEADDLVQAVGDDGQLHWVPKSQAAGMGSALPDVPKAPAGVQEYEYAKSQGYKGSFLDFQLEQKRAGVATTKVDVHAPTQNMIGNIPEDMMVSPDGNGGYSMSVIPGSPTDIANQKRAGGQELSTDIVTDDINRVLQMGRESALPTTGGTGAALSVIPSTAAFDAGKLLDTIKANTGFDRLQQMREQSPTGGALGSVTKPEMDLLQSVKGSLEQSQSKEQFDYNLKRLYNVYLDTVHGPTGGQKRYDLGPRAPGPGEVPQGQVPSGYVPELPPGFK